MFVRALQSPVGDFRFTISMPEKVGADWAAILKIESPTEETRELGCYGADALDAILYGVKLASVNVRAFKEEGVKLQWLNDDDCGFEYPTGL